VTVELDGVAVFDGFAVFDGVEGDVVEGDVVEGDAEPEIADGGLAVTSGPDVEVW
jgi:hypothetical protein